MHVDGYDEVTRFQLVRTEGFQLYLTREGTVDWLGPVSDGEVKRAQMFAVALWWRQSAPVAVDQSTALHVEGVQLGDDVAGR